ncbi:hypothetical protein K420107F6_11880 [Lactonifactor longoviformis]
MSSPTDLYFFNFFSDNSSVSKPGEANNTKFMDNHANQKRIFIQKAAAVWYFKPITAA